MKKVIGLPRVPSRFPLHLPHAERPGSSEDGSVSAAQPLGPHIEASSALILSRFGNSVDVAVRKLRGLTPDKPLLAVIYLENNVDNRTLNDNIIQPLITMRLSEEESRSGIPAERLQTESIASGKLSAVHTVDDAVRSLLGGSCLILTEGDGTALCAEAVGGEQRGVEEPSTQTVIRGPQYSFNENICTNIGLLRRIIRSANLWFDSMTIGRETQTRVSVAYLNGVAKQTVIDEVKRRLQAIDIDGVLESGYIEEFIQDKTFTSFPTLMNVERPDVVAAALLEGQVAVMVDGSPFVLLAPVTFFKFFQSAEDYYQRFDIATFLRLLRLVAFLFSMVLPALYIAATTFHQDMLPTTLLISLAAQREGIPFPGLIEAFTMELTFEVLREAGVRMPRAIGPAISIVGALVLGQAAVQAGLVSPAMVMVVSFTAISNFVTPQINIAIAARIIRFSLMLLAGVLGFFGIMSGFIVLLVHLAGLESFGVPYMTPLAPFKAGSLKDIVIRAPRWAMSTRPAAISPGKRKKNAKMPPWQKRRFPK